MVDIDAVVVVGKKVMLREKRADDADADFRWRRDPELAELDAASVIRQSLKDFRRDLESELRHPTPWVRRYAIDTVEGVHIGNCMAYDIDTLRGESEIGILVGERDYWNDGYGREALKLLLEEMFKIETMNRVYLHTLRWNARARRAFAGAGLREVGPDPRGGHDFILMETTRAEWEAFRQRELAAQDGARSD